MKRVLVTEDDDKRIKVAFSGGCFTHKDLRLITRAIVVQFRTYHYNLLHPIEKKPELSEAGV